MSLFCFYLDGDKRAVLGNKRSYKVHNGSETFIFLMQQFPVLLRNVWLMELQRNSRETTKGFVGTVGTMGTMGTPPPSSFLSKVSKVTMTLVICGLMKPK